MIKLFSFKNTNNFYSILVYLYMRLYIYIMAIVCFTINCNEIRTIDSGSINIEGKWILKNRNVFDSVLNFRKENFGDSNLVWLKQFTFSDTTVSFEAIKTVPRCGNGIFYLDSINYWKSNDTIYFGLKGGYTLGNRFNYKAEYLINNERDSSFSLSRINLILEEWKDYWDVHNLNID
ncbi:MAG: hypothetical protein ABF242_06090 [Flavobacteriales bacterium]